MSDRSIRRAAEREALKATRQAAVRQAAQSANSTSAAAQETAEPVAAPNPAPSAARLAANRANAQSSTGPTSKTGKAKASLNALKTGLTGVTVLLPSDDADHYKTHILAYEKQFKPIGPEECALVQSIADIRWRLNRIPALEIALLTIGHDELAGQDETFNRPDLTPVLEMEIRRAYERDFRNLHLQESRLARRREKEMAELRALQAERKEQENEGLKTASRHYIAALFHKRPFDFASFGFEFSKERFIAFLAGQSPSITYKELTAEPAETMQAAA